MCNPCGFTIENSYRYHGLLINNVKRTTKIDGMGPFNLSLRLSANLSAALCVGDIHQPTSMHH